MKKLFLFGTLIFAASFFLMSCGPSEEEKAKMEQDAMQAVDSMMNALETEMQPADSVPEPLQEEPAKTKESEEAPKQ